MSHLSGHDGERVKRYAEQLKTLTELNVIRARLENAGGQRVRLVESALRAGAPVGRVADAAGVTRQTIRTWQVRGRIRP